MAPAGARVIAVMMMGGPPWLEEEQGPRLTLIAFDT